MGRNKRTIRSIADIVDPGSAKLFVKFMRHRNAKSTTGDIHRTVGQMVMLARDWAKAPQEQIDELVRLRKVLDPGPREMTAKNRSTLRHFENPDLVDRFMVLPQESFERARSSKRLTVKQAVQMQLALAVELLTVAPVRIRNLASTRISQHLVSTGVGATRRVHLIYGGAEVKNGEEIEHVLQARTVKMIEEYVQRALPLLHRGSSDYLFPGVSGRGKNCGFLSGQIAQFTSKKIGVRLTAHQFRHLAGYIYLCAHPGAYEVVRRLLGHRSIQTTINAYAGMEKRAAIALYDQHVAHQRERAAQSKRQKVKSGRRVHGPSK